MPMVLVYRYSGPIVFFLYDDHIVWCIAHTCIHICFNFGCLERPFAKAEEMNLTGYPHELTLVSP